MLNFETSSEYNQALSSQRESLEAMDIKKHKTKKALDRSFSKLYDLIYEIFIQDEKIKWPYHSIEDVYLDREHFSVLFIFKGYEVRVLKFGIFHPIKIVKITKAKYFFQKDKEEVIAKFGKKDVDLANLSYKELFEEIYHSLTCELQKKLDERIEKTIKDTMMISNKLNF